MQAIGGGDKCVEQGFQGTPKRGGWGLVDALAVCT